MARKLLVIAIPLGATALCLGGVSLSGKLLYDAWRGYSTRQISRSRYELTEKQLDDREPLLAAAIAQYDSGTLVGSDAVQHADLIKQPEWHFRFADRDEYVFQSRHPRPEGHEGPPALIIEVKNGRVVTARLAFPEW